ncbi:MAG: MFS transporter [Bacillota bacterium]|nr:MAG: MFS transporter [Bacillota bacterium]
MIKRFHMKKSIITLILYFFFQGLLHNLGHPVTPAFVRSLEIQDYMFGVFFASMSFGLMIGAPLWGTLGDRGRRKTYIFTGLALYSLGQIGFAYSGHEIIMIFFRFVSGFGVVGSMTILTSILIEKSDVKDRAKHLAYSAAAVTLGASLGYYAGGFLSTNLFFREFLGTSDYRVVFLIQALLNIVYASIVISTLHIDQSHLNKAQRSSFFKSLKEVANIKPSLLIFLISLTLITIGATNLSKYIDVYFDELGYSPSDLGTFVMTTGIVSLFASLLIVPVFAKFRKQLYVIAIIQLLSAFIVFFVFRAEKFLLTIYTIYMIYVIFKAIYQPLEQNYIAKHASEGKYGRIMGLRQSFVSIGMIIGPLLGGFLYEIRPLVLFDFSGISFIIGVLLLGVVYVLQKKEQATEALGQI